MDPNADPALFVAGAGQSSCEIPANLFADGFVASGSSEWEEELRRVESMLDSNLKDGRPGHGSDTNPADNTSAVSVLEAIDLNEPCSTDQQPPGGLAMNKTTWPQLGSPTCPESFPFFKNLHGPCLASRRSLSRDVLGLHLVRETKSHLTPHGPYPPYREPAQVHALGSFQTPSPMLAQTSNITDIHTFPSLLGSSSSVSSHVSLTPPPPSKRSKSLFKGEAHQPVFDSSPVACFPIDSPAPRFDTSSPPPRFSIDSPLPFLKSLQPQPESKHKQGSKQRRFKTHQAALPSRFCHLCSRTQKSRKVVCSNISNGSCRKAVCEPCFAEQEHWDWEKATTPGSNWKCPHCLDLCPTIPRARCIIYKAVNTKRRNARIALQRKCADVIVDALH
jgi:hypothetical protein